MQFPMFQTNDELLTVILVIVAFSLWVQRFRVFKYVGPALTVILIGLTLVNLRIVPGYQDVYGVVITYCVPMSISIYLLNINLKELAKLSGKALVALVCAVFSVCLVATAFGVVFGSRMFEGWKIAGMFVGTYTGGSANLTAIAVGLNAANETIAAANAADYVIGMPTLFLMFAAPALFQNVKFLKRFWPYHLSDEERIGDNEEPVLMAEQKWSIQDIACLLAVSVTVVTISTKRASFLPPDFASGQDPPDIHHLHCSRTDTGCGKAEREFEPWPVLWPYVSDHHRFQRGPGFLLRFHHDHYPFLLLCHRGKHRAPPVPFQDVQGPV